MIGWSRTDFEIQTVQTVDPLSSWLTRRRSEMPPSKRVSTRPQSPAHSSQDEGGAPAKTTTNVTKLPVGERISTRGWSVESLLELGGGKFEEVERVSVRKMPPQRIVEVVRKYEELGRPLILEEWHLRKEWNKAILSVDYLVGRSPDRGRPSVKLCRTYS